MVFAQGTALGLRPPSPSVGIPCKSLKTLVGPTELESVTSCVSSRRSNQLSYGPVVEDVLESSTVRALGAVRGTAGMLGTTRAGRERPGALPHLGGMISVGGEL